MTRHLLGVAGEDPNNSKVPHMFSWMLIAGIWSLISTASKHFSLILSLQVDKIVVLLFRCSREMLVLCVFVMCVFIAPFCMWYVSLCDSVCVVWPMYSSLQSAPSLIRLQEYLYTTLYCFSLSPCFDRLFFRIRDDVLGFR